MQLEEGEISEDSGGDDDINPYIPLERPSLPLEPLGVPNPIHILVDQDDDDDGARNMKTSHGFGSSDSESDADDFIVGKRMKISRPETTKYNIWTKDPNDFLTDVMDKIGMERPENDRNVENYLVRNWKPQGQRKRKIPKAPKGDILHPAAQPKELAPLTVTEENSFEEVAGDIAIKLDEPNYLLVLKIVETIGKSKAIELFEATREIESEGGMLILSGNRKRTSGGIFIFLVRDDKDITGAQRNEIFESSNNTPLFKKKRRKNRKGTKHGKDQLSNPPPSPDPEADLPPLPHRKQICYDEVFLV